MLILAQLASTGYPYSSMRPCGQAADTEQIFRSSWNSRRAESGMGCSSLRQARHISRRTRPQPIRSPMIHAPIVGSR